MGVNADFAKTSEVSFTDHANDPVVANVIVACNTNCWSGFNSPTSCWEAIRTKGWLMV
jgi:hypothetical protein